MVIIRGKGEKRRYWCRGAWERGKCPNPQTHSHAHTVASAASRDFWAAPCIGCLLESISDHPSYLKRMNPSPGWRCQPTQHPWGATRDPGEEDEGTNCSFAEGNVCNFLFFFFFFSSVIPPLYEIYGQAWNAQAAGSASHPGLWKASYGALGRAEDGKGKGGEVVSSWFRLGPRLMSKIPGTRPPCLDAIIFGVIIIWMLLEHPLRVGVLVLLAVDRPTPGMCLTFRSIFKARVLFSRAAGLVFGALLGWPLLSQVNPSGTAEEGM